MRVAPLGGTRYAHEAGISFRRFRISLTCSLEVATPAEARKML
jgi:hypothetical protein